MANELSIIPFLRFLALSLCLVPAVACYDKSEVFQPADEDEATDVDYDGEWDTDFLAAPHEFDAAPGEVKVVRMQAAAGGWWVGGTSLIWSVDDPCPAPNACSGCATGASSSASAGLLLAALLAGTRRRRRLIG